MWQDPTSTVKNDENVRPDVMMALPSRYLQIMWQGLLAFDVIFFFKEVDFFFF